MRTICKILLVAAAVTIAGDVLRRYRQHEKPGPAYVSVKCEDCQGAGELKGPCLLCEATGRVTNSEGVRKDCPLCAGTGQRFGACPICGGSGELVKETLQGRRRPRPPKPPGPTPEPPVPLDDSDTRLLGRLRPHFLGIARREIQAEMKAAAEEFGNFDPLQDDLPELAAGDGELPQGFIGTFFAGTVWTAIKKWVPKLVAALVTAAIIALIVKYWVLVSAAAVGLVAALRLWIESIARRTNTPPTVVISPTSPKP
jgi:hypothetical protein